MLTAGPLCVLSTPPSSLHALGIWLCRAANSCTLGPILHVCTKLLLLKSLSPGGFPLSLALCTALTASFQLLVS